MDISAFTDKDLSKYKYLTGKDLELIQPNIEKVRFDYSPLGNYAKSLTRLESIEKSNKQLADFIDVQNNKDGNNDNNGNNIDDDDDNDDNVDNDKENQFIEKLLDNYNNVRLLIDFKKYIGNT